MRLCAQDPLDVGLTKSWLVRDTGCIGSRCRLVTGMPVFATRGALGRAGRTVGGATGGAEAAAAARPSRSVKRGAVAAGSRAANIPRLPKRPVGALSPGGYPAAPGRGRAGRHWAKAHVAVTATKMDCRNGGRGCERRAWWLRQRRRGSRMRG